MEEMRTKRKEKPQVSNPLQRLILHVHSIHKLFPYEYLNELSVSELLSLAHPFYREYHKNQIYG